MTTTAPHILVALQSTDSAERITRAAVALIADPRTEVTLLRVVAAPRQGRPRLAGDLPSLVDMAERQADAELRVHAGAFSPCRVRRVVEVGIDPAAEIVRCLRRTGADCVVMTAGEPRGFAALFRRSVAAIVQKSGLAPVVVVPSRNDSAAQPSWRPFPAAG